MARKNRVPMVECRNCEAKLKADDSYCPNCGQENHDHHLTIKAMLYEFVEGITHFDNKVFSTLKTLFVSPGKLSKDFIEGKRVRYVPPVRLYIFVAFIFFFVMNIVLSKLVESILDSSKQLDSIKKVGTTHQIKIDKAQYEDLKKWKSQNELRQAVLDMVKTNKIDLDKKDKEGNETQVISKAMFSDFIKKNAYDSVSLEARKTDIVLEKTILKTKVTVNVMGKEKELTTDKADSILYRLSFSVKPQYDTVGLSITKFDAKDYYNDEHKLDSLMAKSDLPWYKKMAKKNNFKLGYIFTFGNVLEKKVVLEKISHNVTKYGSIAMYIMMPLSALYLFLLFYRRQKYYFPHFLFSMHLHTFIFICISIFIGISSLIKKYKFDTDLIAWLFIIFFAGIYFYYYKAQKYFYGTSRVKTILEGGITAVLYFFTLFGLAFVVFLASALF